MEDTFALSFDGIDDHVTIPDDPSLDGTDQFCYSFWVKTEKLPSENSMLIGKKEAYRVVLTPTGRITWAIATEDNPWSSPGTAIAGYGTIEPGLWDHVVTGYDGTYTYLYRNGQLDIKSNLLSGTIVDNDHPLVFGKGNNSDTDYFKGAAGRCQVFQVHAERFEHSAAIQPLSLMDTTSSGPADTLNSVTGPGSLEKVLLFPNPASHRVTIRGLPPDASISLYSLQGKQLHVEIQRGSMGSELDVSPFSPGLYILTCTYQDLKAVRKLIISPKKAR